MTIDARPGDYIMRPGKFWGALHRLAVELEQQGENDKDRASALLAEMEGMSSEYLHTSLENLEIAAASLAELLNRAKTI